MVHGYARRLDMAKMVNAFHLQLAGLQTAVYLEYVPSLANIADLPPCDEFEVLERRKVRRGKLYYLRGKPLRYSRV